MQHPAPLVNSVGFSLNGGRRERVCEDHPCYCGRAVDYWACLPGQGRQNRWRRLGLPGLLGHRQNGLGLSDCHILLG